MNREKILVKNMFLYLLGNFASKCLWLVLLPVYTYYLSAEDFGYYDLIATSAMILVPVISLQQNEGIYRFLLDAKSRKDIEKVVTNSVLILLFSIIVFSLVAIPILYYKPIRYVSIVIIQIVLTLIFTVWQQAARGMRKNSEYSISGVVLTFLMLISNIFLLVFLRLGVEALILSNIFATAAVILYLEIKLKILGYIKLREYDKYLVKELLKFSIPLLPNSINWWVVNSSSRYVITMYMGLGATGIYAVANRFPSILFMLNSIFYLAWQESAITEYSSEDKDEFYTKMFNIYMSLQISMFFILIPVTKWALVYLIDAKFQEAALYIPYLYLGAVFSSFSTFYGTGYLSSKETKGAFVTTLVGAIVNIAVILLLIDKIGMHAAALANMSSFLVIWLFRAYQTRKYFRINVNKNKLALFSLISLLFFILYYSDIYMAEVYMMIGAMLVFILFNSKSFGFAFRMIKSKIQSF